MKRIVFLLTLVFSYHLLFGEYHEESLDVIRSKAEAGEARYQAKLGELYIRGTDGLAPNIEKAIPLLRKSYRQQHPFAAYMLGYLAMTGVPLEKSYPEYFKEAFSGIQKMVEGGDPEAMLKLSAFYRYGWATGPDPDKANELLRSAANEGVPRAIYILGFSYLTGQLTEKNYARAYQLLSQISDTNKEAEYQLANMIFAGLGVTANREKGLEMIHRLQAPNPAAAEMIQEGDQLIPDLPPPTYSLAIEEGSCGENVLWTIMNRLGKPTSQYEVNVAGGAPDRGLHSDEMFVAMNALQIPYREISETFKNASEDELPHKYHNFLYNKIIPIVLEGNPVMIGVKVYPSQFPQWAYDHFILLVGYNRESDELIFNDFNNRRRLPAASLLNKDPGYSFINPFNIVFAVVFTELQ